MDKVHDIFDPNPAMLISIRIGSIDPADFHGALTHARALSGRFDWPGDVPFNGALAPLGNRLAAHKTSDYLKGGRAMAGGPPCMTP